MDHDGETSRRFGVADARDMLATQDIHTMQAEQITHAAALIGNADALVIAAGAGMGVDSGLPDFRSDNGFWRAYPALARSGIQFTEIAAPHSFRIEPELAWGFYGHRLGLNELPNLTPDFRSCNDGQSNCRLARMC